MHRFVWLVWLSVALLSGGCDEDLPKATEIARMRVLGATLAVEGDPTRTTPAPGESVNVELATVLPALSDDRSRLQAMIITCTAPDRYTGGVPICQELIDVASAPGAATGAIELPEGFPEYFECVDSFMTPPVGPLSLNCKRGEPTFRFSVPPDYRADELLYVGVICERGPALLDPELPSLFGCKDSNAEAISFHGLIKVRHAAQDENHNPDMAALRLVREIDGAWEPADPAQLVPDNTQCRDLVRGSPRDPKLPAIIGNLPITIEYDAAARELDDEGEPEGLEVTVYATDGELERRFTVFDPEDDGDDAGVLRDVLRWKSPKVRDLDEQGQLVRFFVTVRDGRGGFGRADYALCAINKML